MKRNKVTQFILYGLCLFLIDIAIFFFLTSKLTILLCLFLGNIVLIGYFFFIVTKTELTNQEKINKATEIAKQSLKFAVEEIPVGLIVYDAQTKEPKWFNPFAEQVFEIDSLDAAQVDSYITLFEKGKDIFKLNEAVYRFKVDQEQRTIIFQDVTQESTLYHEKMNMQPAVGIVSVDNYDDVIENMDEKQISYLSSFITTMISDWMNEYQAFYKRLNEERYLFVAQFEVVQQMMQDKFSILDHIRKESSERAVSITLSMGIAYGMESLAEIGNIAQTNLDMALVRGGDQVVVKEAKNHAKPLFFGGKTTSVSKRTRVRSRAMSTALRMILSEASDVYIMGHEFPDMDAIGAAFGVARLVNFYDKQAWIVIDSTKLFDDVQRVKEKLKEEPALSSQVITPKEAMKRKTDNSLLIMVDYHRPSLSISQELYEKFDKVVIIDHHRRGDEFPEKPLLSYIESSASSASELVTELVEYASSATKKLEKLEATLLLAGIVVDTKSFSIRTTSKTFDAASYLRTCGADSSLVQYLLSSDLTSYLEMNDLISRSEYVTEDIVFAVGKEEESYSSITAAKAADTLLSMAGINAAFVITKRPDKKIGISARSNGKINVQLIMESFGGGGHFTNAAAQIANATLGEVRTQLTETIHKNINEMYDKE